MASIVSINVDPSNPESKKEAIRKLFGLPATAGGPEVAAAFSELFGPEGEAAPVEALPPETVAALARLHGISEREVRTCHEVGAAFGAYARMKRDQQRARASAAWRR